jgi:hypothetical protein
MARNFGGFAFSFVTVIEPDRDVQGEVITCLPQGKYRNPRGQPLHTHGHGPFCRFRIPPALAREGIYVVTVNGGIAYVEKCQNLAERFNAGYGVIHPRNCFRGGQTTNCRINALILQRTKEAARIELWFHASSDCDKTERQLISALGPAWNLQGRVAARSKAELRKESQHSITPDRVINTEDVMPIFKLNLEKTYYEKGFFNVTVDFESLRWGHRPNRTDPRQVRTENNW